MTKEGTGVVHMTGVEKNKDEWGAIYGVGGVWVQLLWGQGDRARVILFYVNVFIMRPRSRLSSQILRYRLPWLSSASGGLYLVGFHSGDRLLFSCGE